MSASTASAWMLMLVGNSVDGVALPEWRLTVQAGKVGALATDWGASKGLGSSCFNDGALVGIGIGCGVHSVPTGICSWSRMTGQ